MKILSLMWKIAFTLWFDICLKGKENIFLWIKKSKKRFLFFLSRLKEIDWLDFCTGTVVDSFANHIRLYRKAKERMRLEKSNDICSCFFDLEAEHERGICRDEVCLDQEKEKSSFVHWNSFGTLIKIWIFFDSEFLRDIVEVLLYILLPANEFRCVPIRKLLRVSFSSSFDRVEYWRNQKS